MTKARVNADNASADIQGVTAGTGLTGGGTSGTVTLDVDTTVIQTRVANVSDTEIGYLDGVTSAIQTQLDSKVSTAGGSVISANTSATALEIRQTGAGNALVIEDDTNPDSTPFVVTSAGSVGIATSTPQRALDINGGIALTVAGGGTRSINWINSTSGANQANISGDSSATPFLSFQTNAAERMLITSAGDVGIGKTPSYKLDVNGTVNATALYVGGSPLSSGGMTLIASASPTGVGTYTFSSIPSTYKHLLLLIENLSSSGGEISIYVRFNGDTAGNYHRAFIKTTVNTVSGQAQDNGQSAMTLGLNARNTAGWTRLQSEIWIMDYASSQPTKTLSASSFGNAYGTTDNQSQFALARGGWNNTSAVNSITLYDQAGPYNFSNGTLKLYGVS